MLRKKKQSKRFIIRRLDKETGIRHTHIVYASNGVLHSLDEEIDRRIDEPIGRLLK